MAFIQRCFETDRQGVPVTASPQATENGAATTKPIPGGPSLFKRLKRLARRDWLVSIVALGVFANGSLEVVTSLRTHQHTAERFAFALPFGLNEWNRTASVVLGFTLVFFSFHLLRRRKLAWWLGVSALALLTIVHIALRHHAYLAFGSTAMLALLVATRSRFTVRFEPRGILRGFELMVIMLAMAVLWGTVAFYLLDHRDFGREFGFGEALVRTLRQFVLIGNHDLVPLTRDARWFLRIQSILGVTAEVLALFSVFRPVAYRLGTAPQERRRAQASVTKYGRSTYDYFKVWPDKSLYFPTPDSFVGYRVHYGVAVSLGDPTGPPDELEEAIRGFVRYARDNGWVAAFLMPDDAAIYRRLGLWLVKIGEEASVNLERFGDSTSRNKYFRQVGRKMEEQGVEFGRHVPPHAESLVEEAEQLSAKWIKQARYREFGFVQGTLDRGYLEKTVLDVLRDKEGRLIAFVNEVPSYRPGEASFDMMRRLPEAHWATMDYLFLRIMLELKSEGYRTFNLGLAPFAGVGEDPESNLLEKTIKGVAPYAQRLVRSRGLTQYKKKFEPFWEDRYVVYEGGPLVLPQIALALTTVA